MKISIVVLNWNRKADTLACLQSLDKLRTPADFEVSIYVVDNASTDGSIEAFSKITTPTFRLIQNKDNLGFAAGNNIGLTQALEDGAEWLLIINNDTLIDRNFLINLSKVIDRGKNVGVISPKIYFAPGFEFHRDRYSKALQGSVLWSAGGKMDWDNVFGVNIGVDDVDRGQFDEQKEIDFATGACICIASKVFEKIGLFNEKYFMYFEDVEFSLRALRAGFKVIYSPKTYLWHKVAQGSSVGSNLNDYFITRNRLLFGMKYANLRTKLALIKESLGFLVAGRKWQKRGVIDFMQGKLGKGSWK